MDVRHNQAVGRFESGEKPNLAVLEYRLKGNVLDLAHTEVPENFHGKGIGRSLVVAALEWARSSGFRVVATCSYAKGFLANHPEFEDLRQPLHLSGCTPPIQNSSPCT